jgi:large subunit ribosomal protein L35
MGKKKTSKTAAKRFRLTANKRLRFARPGRGHLLSFKSRKRKRHLRRAALVNPADEKRLRALITS